jgi:membrane protease YdiL (CAAX protease family)
MAAYIIHALFLFNYKQFQDILDLGPDFFLTKLIFSTVIISSSVLVFGLIKRELDPGRWPGNEGFHGFNGWRKVTLLLTLFLFTSLSSGHIGSLQHKYFGGSNIVGKTAAEYVEEYYPDMSEEDKASTETLVNLQKFGRVALTALSEEVFSRWLILGTFLLLFRPLTAISLSAFLFGLSHVFSPLGIGEDLGTILGVAVPAVVSGLFFGFVYWRCGLVWAIFLHFVANLFAYVKGSEWTKLIALAMILSVPFTLFALSERLVKRIRHS